MGSKLASLSLSFPSRPPGHVSMSEEAKGMLCACSLGRMFPPSAVLPCSKSGVISEYLRYTHCLPLIYNPATRHDTPRQTPAYCSRSSFAIEGGRKEGRKEASKQANRGGSNPKLLAPCSASITRCKRDKRAKLFNGRPRPDLLHLADRHQG